MVDLFDMNGNGRDKDKAGRGLLEEEDDNNERLDKKPLYIWVRQNLRRFYAKTM